MRGGAGGRPIGRGNDSHADGWAEAPPISLLVLPKEKRAVHGPKRKNASAGRSAPARTSCRRRGMAGGPLQQSGTETHCPWGNLRPGEVWDTSSFSFRCRWPVVDESCNIGQTTAPTTARAARSDCAAVGGFAAYGCGVPLAGNRNARKEEPAEHW